MSAISSVYIMLLRCPDKPGIVHRATGAILRVGGNIIENAQFTDPDSQTFVMRTRFQSSVGTQTVRQTIAVELPSQEFDVRLRPENERYRALLMVSKLDHCLLDLLYRHRNGELDLEIPVVVSNHPDLRPLVTEHGIPFIHLPVTPETKMEQEQRLREVIELYRIDLVVLARYMQILSPKLTEELQGCAINIHHAFLPGFKGAKPYHQAHKRGVKLIGATAHYVTADLDEGPIIEQDVIRVNHTHDAKMLARLGRDVERRVLSQAVQAHAQDRVILIGNRTVVFG